MSNIKQTFIKHRWSIIRIYGYLLAGQALSLVEPYLLGRAIDGLLLGDFTFLALLLGIFLLESLMIYRRMVFDTKVYVQIYNEIIIDYLRQDKDTSPSTRLARTDMANSIVNFVEHDLHYFITSAMTVLGSLYFIFAGSHFAGLIVGLSAIPTLMITSVFARKIEQGTRVGNTHYESKADTIQSGDNSRIERFYARRKKILVASSTLQGKYWASLSTTRAIFLVLAVFVFTRGKFGLTQGEAVTMYTYISQFLGALLSIPVAVDVFTRIRDVLGRLRRGDDTSNTEE